MKAMCFIIYIYRIIYIILDIYILDIKCIHIYIFNKIYNIYIFNKNMFKYNK